MTVAAPGRVSTITLWRQFSVIFWPITRARMSVEPPGANGTMILIGRSGYLSAGACAPAAPAASTAATRASACALRRRQAAVVVPTLLSRFLALSAARARRRITRLRPARCQLGIGAELDAWA